ncbi:hypothetical protein SAMN04487897_101404 [Paenibacillus sp. yr247]|uniref:hypothetical protein n=1 Tax=Paenibacillus sp. yr247 TaxID=1761880 RepID=UPI000886A9C5|nr:hypothetical protein [Paenibacillus sp. yr247]SDM89540.1 hypothetical protein SAMN04487897_101404 [Paenibacillus sp. yr247]
MKVVTMLLPGYAYTKSNNTIAFYEISLKGKKITFNGKAYLEAFHLPKETLQIGVLARDVDTLNFLSLLSQSGNFRDPSILPRQAGMTWLFSDFLYEQGIEDALKY